MFVHIYRSRSMSLFRPTFFTSFFELPLSFIHFELFGSKKKPLHLCCIGTSMTWSLQKKLKILSWIKGSRFVTWSLAIGNMESNDINSNKGCLDKVPASNDFKLWLHNRKTLGHCYMYMMTHRKHIGMIEGIIGITTATNYPTTNIHRKEKQ